MEPVTNRREVKEGLVHVEYDDGCHVHDGTRTWHRGNHMRIMRLRFHRGDGWQDGVMMKRMAIGMAALTFVLTACQSAAENIAENLVEQIAEQGEGVGDVDINLESGEINLETEEGAITIGGGDMPDGFPIPAPDGYCFKSLNGLSG